MENHEDDRMHRMHMKKKKKEMMEKGALTQASEGQMHQ